jgi:hypothetical protein
VRHSPLGLIDKASNHFHMPFTAVITSAVFSIGQALQSAKHAHAHALREAGAFLRIIRACWHHSHFHVILCFCFFHHNPKLLLHTHTTCAAFTTRHLLMTPHANEDTTSALKTDNMSNDSAPLTNGETPRSRALSVRTVSIFTTFLAAFPPPSTPIAERTLSDVS